MQTKHVIPGAIALAVVGAVAMPAAAHAAEPRALKTPQIEGVGGDGQWNLVGSESNAAGEVSVRSSDAISIGSVASATGFRNKKVVVSDENGAEVCDSGATAGQSTAWMCTATPRTLPVGDHTMTAVAYSKDGSRKSATSLPVTVHVLEGTPQTGAPAAPEVAVSHEGTTTTVRFTSGTPYGTLKTFGADGKPSVTKHLDEHGATTLTFDDSDLRGPVTYTAVVVDAKNVASEPTAFTVGDGDATAPPVAQESNTAIPAPGPVDTGFTAGTGSDAGSAESDAPTAPKVSVDDDGTTTVVRITGGPAYGTVKTFTAGGGTDVTKHLDASGSAELRYDTEGGERTYTAVVLDAKNVASQPTAFTVGSGQPDSTVIEAPSVVDPEFSAGTGDETVARPELGSVHEFNRNGAHWMVVNAKGVAGAEAVFTDARGVETKGEFSPTGSLVIRIDLPYGAEPVLTLVQKVDGAASAPVTVRPNK